MVMAGAAHPNMADEQAEIVVAQVLAAAVEQTVVDQEPEATTESVPSLAVEPEKLEVAAPEKEEPAAVVTAAPIDPVEQKEVEQAGHAVKEEAIQQQEDVSMEELSEPVAAAAVAGKRDHETAETEPDSALTNCAVEAPAQQQEEEGPASAKRQKLEEAPAAEPVAEGNHLPLRMTVELCADAAAFHVPLVLAAPLTPAPTAPVMLSRDDMAKIEEDSGLLRFEVITNDGRPDHMMQLTTLKNIFAKQLPKMPKEYIVRLVFDRNHRSMIILKNGTHVIGGICYRPFEPNHFAEIAFCAINATDQVKGYGTRLMNHLKEFVKTTGITHFLTYADNYAIGYFKKQGFAKVVSMPKWNWYGYIKDYDGGTLMECTIHHQIDYLRITSMVHKQRKVRRLDRRLALDHSDSPLMQLSLVLLPGDPRQDQGAVAGSHCPSWPDQVCRRPADGHLHDPWRQYVTSQASLCL